MTEDASPENLRKFLESDDPAMVRMGLSMAKGSGVPEELLPTILSLYMWDDDKTVRAAAKSVFTKYAPAELKEKVKKKLNKGVRCTEMTEDTSPENLRKFLESDDPAMVRMGISMAKGGVEITVKDLEHFLKSEDVETIKTGIMLADEAGVGDEAMEMLCEPLGEDDEVCQATAEALGEIGDCVRWSLSSELST